MTKEEKIKEAWKEYLVEVSDYIDDNGWCNCRIAHKLSLSGDSEDSECGHFVRPKSLQGIENNNGWIRIESEVDLPEFFGSDYWVILNGNVTMLNRNGSFSNVELWKNNVTHYQPIIKPDSPLY